VATERALTVPCLLSARAAGEPDKIALSTDGGQTLSLAEWDARSRTAAGALTAAGVAHGDLVALWFAETDWIEYAVAYCAVQAAGAVAVPLSTRLGVEEAARLCERYRIATVIGADAPDADWSRLSTSDLAAAGPAPKRGPAPGDVGQILFTSGTTAQPKGVSATHANLTYGCAAERRHRSFAHSRHLLHAFPIGTNAAQLMMMHALDAAPAVLSQARFTPRRYAALIQRHAVGTAFVVPAMAMELLSGGLAEAFDLSSVRLIGSAAAALPPRVAAGLTTMFPRATVVNYYTSTEAAPAQTAMVFDPARPGSLGRPGAGSHLRIAGPDGEPLPAGESGEVWLRSAAGGRRYHGDAAASETTFRDGWVRMGDVGYLDDDGYLHLVDRESDVVKIGAFKVSTLHVEAALHEHPDITQAAVVGVPHPVLGATLLAAAVARTPLTLPQLRRFLSGRLPDHELPDRLILLDELPRNDAGKVRKRLLRELALDNATENPCPTRLPVSG
jgi:acyl-CoA synthetase (AMP-forming)/AMP-acid ligase II